MQILSKSIKLITFNFSEQNNLQQNNNNNKTHNLQPIVTNEPANTTNSLAEAIQVNPPT